MKMKKERGILQRASQIIIENLGKGVFITLIILPLLLIGVYLADLGKKAPVREDAVGYYSYLPAFFIYRDLSFEFMIDDNYSYTGGENVFEREFNPEEAEVMGFNEIEEGKYLNKYPIGVAVMLSPFYVVGHFLSILFQSGLTGWSYFYQYSAFYGGIFYFLLSVLFLAKILKRYYSDSITLFTLLAVVFGTNLLNYSTYENIFSHVYSFFLITLFISIVPKWLKDRTTRNSMLVALNLGLIALVRPTNLIVSMLLFLYGIGSTEQLKARVSLFLGEYKKGILIILLFLLILVPQLLYWKIATGHFVAYSYGEEGFNFLKPQLLRVLFGTSKGLFFWSPILLFSIPGLFLLRNKAREYFFPIIAILIVQIYIVSSWWNWEYGWSYGHRAFTDFIAMFAMGLAAFYSAIKQHWLKIMVFAISLFFIFLSVFQMLQYWLKILPPARTTLEDYGKIFLSLDPELKLFWSKYFQEGD